MKPLRGSEGQIPGSAPSRGELQREPLLSNPETLLGKWEGQGKSDLLISELICCPSTNGLWQPYRAFPMTQPPGPSKHIASTPAFQGTPGLLALSAAAASSLTAKPSQVCFLPFAMPFKDKYVSWK